MAVEQVVDSSRWPRPFLPGGALLPTVGAQFEVL